MLVFFITGYKIQWHCCTGQEAILPSNCVINLVHSEWRTKHFSFQQNWNKKQVLMTTFKATANVVLLHQFFFSIADVMFKQTDISNMKSYIFSLESISCFVLQSQAQLFDVYLNTSCKVLQSKNWTTKIEHFRSCFIMGQTTPKFPLLWGDWDPLQHTLPRYMSPHSKWHLDQFSCVCNADTYYLYFTICHAISCQKLPLPRGSKHAMLQSLPKW